MTPAWLRATVTAAASVLELERRNALSLMITASRARAASVHPSPEGGGWPPSRSEGGRVGVIDAGVQARMRVLGIPHPPRFARHPPLRGGISGSIAGLMIK